MLLLIKETTEMNTYQTRSRLICGRRRRGRRHHDRKGTTNKYGPTNEYYVFAEEARSDTIQLVA